MKQLDLTSENIEQYGFARFFYPEESKLVKGVLQREIEFTDDPSFIKKVNISFPDTELVRLSKEPQNKIILQDLFQLMSAGSMVDPMFFLCKRNGWNQTLRDLELLAARNKQGNLLATAHIYGTINPLGSGMVINLGESLCWLGMILVHQELRRQGIATAIVEKCIQIARMTMDKSVIGLDATQEGLPVYESFGFKSSFRIWRAKISTDTKLSYRESIKIHPVSSVESVSDLLEGTNFGAKLEGLQLIQSLHPEGAWMAEFKGKSVGLVMTRPGRIKPFIGPLLAITPDIAKILLEHCLSYWNGKGCNEVFLDIPEQHFDAISGIKKSDDTQKPGECVLSPDLQVVRGFDRMYQVISETDLVKLTETNLSPNAQGNKIEILENAKNSFQETTDYMKKEVNTLKYLYATGGPEVS